MRRFHTVIAFLVASLMGAPALAQLTPERTYYGRHRPIPILVRTPSQAQGQPSIRLFDPQTRIEREVAPVATGSVNLAAIFPSLWQQNQEQERPHPVLFAQLTVGEVSVGPPLILQPLLDPAFAAQLEADGSPRFKPGKDVYSGLRIYVDRRIILETTLGEVTIALRPDAAPNTAWNFRELCAGGFYTDIVFHRIKPLGPNGHPFVIQAGDPLQNSGPSPQGAGEGGPGYTIDLEPSSLKHDFGIVAMARNNLPNSAGSQFYIALSREGAAHLDGKYATFGEVVAGAEVIRKIAAVELAPGTDKPKDPPVIKRCRLIDAPPFGQGPRPVTSVEPAPAPR